MWDNKKIKSRTHRSTLVVLVHHPQQNTFHLSFIMPSATRYSPYPAPGVTTRLRWRLQVAAIASSPDADRQDRGGLRVEIRQHPEPSLFRDESPTVQCGKTLGVWMPRDPP